MGEHARRFGPVVHGTAATALGPRDPDLDRVVVSTGREVTAIGRPRQAANLQPVVCLRDRADEVVRHADVVVVDGAAAGTRAYDVLVPRKARYARRVPAHPANTALHGSVVEL